VFGHAVFGWDPFAVDWRAPSTPAPTIATPEIPGGHRRKWARKPIRRLTDDEKAALDRGFRDLHPAAIPDAVPVYLSPREPVQAIGLAPSLAPPIAPNVTVPSVTAALFDATATDRQRDDAFTFFDRLETKLDQLAVRKKRDRRIAYEASVHAARQHAERQWQDWQDAQERQRIAAEDEMVTLLLMLHEEDE